MTAGLSFCTESSGKHIHPVLVFSQPGKGAESAIKAAHQNITAYSALLVHLIGSSEGSKVSVWGLLFRSAGVVEGWEGGGGGQLMLSHFVAPGLCGGLGNCSI